MNKRMWKKCLAACGAFTLPLCSCAPAAESSVPESAGSAGDGVSSQTPATGATTAPAVPGERREYPLKLEPEEQVNYAFDEAQMVQPFWYGNVMYNESLCLIEREDGSKTGDLLLTPKRIVSVRDNSLKREYVEGVDWEWDEGTKTIRWLEGSSIPYFTADDIAGKDSLGNLLSSSEQDKYGRMLFGEEVHCTGPWLYEKQIAVTYVYDETEWDGPNTEFKGANLPKTLEKLQNGEDLHVTVFGDSIFEGADSSSKYNRLPQVPMFPQLLEYGLEAEYGGEVTIYNPSVGGKDSEWGKQQAPEVAKTETDLAIIGFGMNDSVRLGVQTAENVQAIMDAIRAENPDCEFIVCSCIVPNRKSGYMFNQGQLPAAYGALETEGVAAVDIYSTHEKILQTKDYIACTGNNVNHPNDWLARLYAMHLLSALIDDQAK